jgi:hypothetical protein
MKKRDHFEEIGADRSAVHAYLRRPVRDVLSAGYPFILHCKVCHHTDEFFNFVFGVCGPLLVRCER